ncbi:MAG TPA: hypothetical protein DCO86_02940 [Spirochaetaceae bacterium]|nr:hypothetical protein [Spirochaetaceae bacterium]
MPDSAVSSIPGIGFKTAEELRSLGVNTPLDLMMLKARSVEMRDVVVNFSEIRESGFVNTFVKVVQKSILPSNILKVIVEDIADDAPAKLKTAVLWCFGRNFLNRFLRLGNVYYLYGKGVRKIEFNNSLQISSFDIKTAYQSGAFYSAQGYGTIKNIYVPSDPSLNSRISVAIRQAIDSFDWENHDFGLTKDCCDRFGLLPAKEACLQYHFPSSREMAEKARRTLSFIEYLEVRDDRFKSDAASARVDSFSSEEMSLVSSLGFELTKSQRDAVFDIFSDLECSHSVFRLLQGEVGSGKTICALLACYHQFLKGGQSAFLAPTEILAYQHYLTASKVFASFGIRVEFISSKCKKAQRLRIAKDLAEGRIGLLIGTHSILSSDIAFRNLRFVVVDEEQRFGVEQKQAVMAKGDGIKVLLMSATPIPRSILKILSQGYECSTLEKFISNNPVKTLLVGQSRRLEAYRSIRNEFEKGNCAYFVVPRIDDENSELKSIKTLEDLLISIFPNISYAVMTSRTKEEDKKIFVQGFLSGKIKYIISTSVVEVGMDNPNATCMVIEDADMFGLSTLHQLRGRVGRSSKPSWCFLVYRDEISDSGKERLRIIKDESDGFKIAEMDLSMRGGGDVIGLKQSGKSTFKFFDFERDQDFLEL